MPKRSNEMRALVRKRWGDRLMCTIKDNEALCYLNGEEFWSEGTSNSQALNKVFKLVTKYYEELGKK